MTPIPVQIGLFGGENHLPDFHVVTAHMRLQPDGTEVFVGEHLRWNRGRGAPREAAPRASAAPEGQIPLFGR